MPSKGSRRPPAPKKANVVLRAKEEEEQLAADNSTAAPAPAPAPSPSAATPRPIPQNQDDLVAANEDLYNKLAERDAAIAQLEADLRSKSAAFDAATTNNSNLQKEVKQYADEVKEERGMREEAQKTANKLKGNAQVKRLEKELAAAKACFDDAQKTADNKTRELDEEKTKSTKLQQTLDGANTETETLLKHVENLKGFEALYHERHNFLMTIGQEFDQVFKQMGREMNPASLMDHLRDLQNYKNQPPPAAKRKYRRVSMADELAGHSDTESELDEIDTESIQPIPEDTTTTEANADLKSPSTKDSEDEVDTDSIQPIFKDTATVDDESQTKGPFTNESERSGREAAAQSEKTIANLRATIDSLQAQLAAPQIDTHALQPSSKATTAVEEGDDIRGPPKKNCESEQGSIDGQHLEIGSEDIDAAPGDNDIRAPPTKVSENERSGRQAAAQSEKTIADLRATIDSLTAQLAAPQIPTYHEVVREKTTLEWLRDLPFWWQFILSMLVLFLFMGNLSAWLERTAWITANGPAMDHLRGMIGSGSVPNTYVMWFEDMIGVDRRYLG